MRRRNMSKFLLGMKTPLCTVNSCEQLYFLNLQLVWVLGSKSSCDDDDDDGISSILNLQLRDVALCIKIQDWVTLYNDFSPLY